MRTNSRELFLRFYNLHVSNWKQIHQKDLAQNRNLEKILNRIENCILDYNLNPKILVEAIFEYYIKNNQTPNIFSFFGFKAVSIYNNYSYQVKFSLSELQEIRISVSKTKILLENLLKKITIYNKGVKALQKTGKADPYFLLAHGIKEVPEDIKEKWGKSTKLREVVLSEIFS